MQEYDEQELEASSEGYASTDIIDEDELLAEEVETAETKQEKKDSAAEKPKQDYTLGIWAMILGILSLLLFCIPVLGLVLATVAIILGIVAAARSNGKKMGVSGIVMGSIGLLSYLIILLFFGGVLSSVKENYDYFSGTAWRNTTDGSVLYLYSDGTFIRVEEEGVFSDNFYAGSYDVLRYEDTGLNFSQLQEQYDGDYAYDVCLYVKQYVNNGKEQQNIAGTMRYFYFIGKEYETGEIVMSYPHDSTQYGSLYPMRETNLEYPSIGNQYLPTTAPAGVTEVPTEEIPTAEIATEEMPTEEIPTEPMTEEITTTEAATEAEIRTEETNGASSTSAIWGDAEDFFEDSKDSWDSFSEEVSSVVEDMSSVAEDVSSAVEDMSSAAEDVSSTIEEITDSDSASQIQKWLEQLVKKIQNWIDHWIW